MIGLLVGVKLYDVRGSLDCDTAEKVGGGASVPDAPPLPHGVAEDL